MHSVAPHDSKYTGIRQKLFTDVVLFQPCIGRGGRRSLSKNEALDKVPARPHLKPAPNLDNATALVFRFLTNKPNIFWCLTFWLDGNALVSINAGTLRLVQLLLGWITVCGGVNLLNHPGT